MTTDAPTKSKDALPKGQPSEKTGEPSAPPEMLTKEQAQKLADEKHSTLDKTIAKLQKEAAKNTRTLEAVEKRAKEAEARDTERQEARDAKELVDAKDNPDQLTIIQQRQKLRSQEAGLRKEREEFTSDKAKNQDEIDSVRDTKLETDIWVIAKKYEVDPMQLKNFGISDLESLEEIAKAISSKKPFVPDSGKNEGGSQAPEGSRAKMASGFEKLHPTK